MGLHPDQAYMIIENCELNRRVGFARASITEAMGCIEDTGMRENGQLYWAYKALVRAKDMLDNGSCT